MTEAGVLHEAGSVYLIKSTNFDVDKPKFIVYHFCR